MKIADSYIDRVKHLPPAPTVAIQLLGLFNDPERDIDRIVELISLDPALTAETLNRCNNCYFSSDPVTDMFEAVFRLGFQQVYCLVISSVGAKTTSMEMTQANFDAVKQWQHSVATAVTAGNLASQAQLSEPVVFSAGLLHDIGKLVFAAADGQFYSEVVAKSGGSGQALAMAEELQMGITHAELGARLLNRWGFPENICNIVQHHHRAPTEAAPFQRKAAVIQVANYVANQLMDSPVDPLAASVCHPEAMRILTLEDADIPTVIADARASMKRVQGLLSLVK